MIESEREKYLGDMNGSGSIQAPIYHRKSKCEGIRTGIMTILDKIPLGKHIIYVALK